jgi:6-phosphogluconate dehydrogenase
MVKAGAPVDAVLDDLIPLLDPGDVVIDGGNSHFEDTERRVVRLEGEGLLFVGAGISGGEEGARPGPSIMPGGSAGAWPIVGEILQAIAARAADGRPCSDWIGPGGSGHFVKMVHNGIEYGDMQLLAEVYDLMHRGLGMDHEAMASVFTGWNAGRLESYLVEITADILAHQEDGVPTLETILDAAGQKGTGRWTVESGLGLGMPVTLIAEAVFARAISALYDERQQAAAVLGGATARIADNELTLTDLENALYASKVVSYAQGFMLLGAMSYERDWNVDLGSVAAIWRAGCIIRAAFLEDIRAAYAVDPDLETLLLAPVFADAITESQGGWRRAVRAAAGSGIPAPASSSALAFFDAVRSARLPANLIQAQRDYFGAHTYERVDRPRGKFFHTNWTGRGGDVSSSSYNA